MNELHKRLARQVLVLMVIDLEYTLELPPTHGHTPLRHQCAWDWAFEILGEETAKEYVQSIKTEKKPPIKTNPWLKASQ